MRKITCTSEDGYMIEFGTDEFCPFILATVDGLYKVENTVYISENTMTDGGTYLGSNAKVRNIILTIIDRPTNIYNINNRDLLYILFRKGAKGTLTYQEDDVVRIIDYYTESIERGRGGARPIVISLLCPDPFFYAPNIEEYFLSRWVKDFEFIHEFKDEKEEFGHREVHKLVEILNDSAYDGIGMNIHITCIGNVVNPSITKVETQERIKLGVDSKPLTLGFGDKLLITTQTNNKHVYLIRDGVRTEINEYLTEDSEFIQIRKGLNTIGFDADVGEEFIDISIDYRMMFEAT